MSITLDKSILNRIFIWLTFLLALFPILTFGIRSILTIVWAVFGFFNVELKRYFWNKENKNHLYYLLFSIFPFIYLIVSLIYSDNLDLGLKRLTQMLPFLVFPVVFYFNKERLNSNQIKLILWVFSISVVLLVFYQGAYSLFKLKDLLADLSNEEIVRNLLPENKSINSDVISSVKTRRFRNFLLDITDTHFTYQGLWIIFSVFFMVKEALKFIKTKKIVGYFVLFVSLMLIIWLFIISSRMPILAMIIGLIYTIFVCSKLKVRTQFGLMGVMGLLLVTGYFVFTPFRVRVDEIFNNKFEMPTENKTSYNYSSVNIRNGIYTCSFSITKLNPIFGVGVGDSQNALNECYNSKIGAKIYTWRDYNTHNQYLFFLVATGIIGLLFFLCVLFMHWRVAFNNRNQLYLYFILVTCFTMLTENVLSRGDGVMFFSFFSSLFLFNLKELNDNY